MTLPSRRYRPSVEALEDRLVLATNRFVLDFTPDRGSHKPFAGSNRSPFALIFQDAAKDVSARRYLDFDGNGVVDADADLRLAADRITGLVADYFRPFTGQNVQVVGVDVAEQTNQGNRELQRGLRSRQRQTFVMFVGGSTQDLGVYGESYQAAVGYNNEDFGRTYATSISVMFAREKPHADPLDFARFVASTVTHEFGHMLGLGHPIPDYTNPLNVMDSSSAGQGDAFLNETLAADLFPRPSSPRTVPRGQNGFEEIVISLAGQRTENGGANTRFRSVITI